MSGINEPVDILDNKGIGSENPEMSYNGYKASPIYEEKEKNGNIQTETEINDDISKSIINLIIYIIF